MRTPADKTITLTFYSHPMKDLKMRWKAQLVFAAGSTDASFATLTVADGEGTPVKASSPSPAPTRRSRTARASSSAAIS